MTDSKTVSFHTLGCKLNFSETSTISRMFTENGYERVDFNRKADVVVINTCSVTDVADKKCRQAIKKAVRNSPDAIVAVIGCYAQLSPENIEKIEGVDIVLDTKDKFRLFEYIENFNNKNVVKNSAILEVEEFQPSWSYGDRTRTFLKVQDGCDYKCAYCTIPLARGKSRNNSVQKTVETVKTIASKGVREVILTGINLGDFGRSTGESFYELIREVEKVEGISRYRISSVEPNLLSDEIIEFVANSEKFMPHFHIPLQSGSNKVLQLMGRRYNAELFTGRIEKVKALIPHCYIGVDVIVGVPGETTELFAETRVLLENLDISELHVFSYSERKNTRASEFQGKVDADEKKNRSKILLALSENKMRNFYEKYSGKNAVVLFEDFNDNGVMYGYTENYIKTQTSYKADISNKLVNVRLGNINSAGNAEVEIFEILN